MAIAVISLDIEKRVCTLTIDGVLVPSDSLYFNKNKDYNGNDYLSFGYMTVTNDKNGMKQMVEYILPREENEDMHEYSVQKNGLACRIIDKTKELMKDVANFLTKKP